MREFLSCIASDDLSNQILNQAASVSKSRGSHVRICEWFLLTQFRAGDASFQPSMQMRRLEMPVSVSPVVDFARGFSPAEMMCPARTEQTRTATETPPIRLAPGRKQGVCRSFLPGRRYQTDRVGNKTGAAGGAPL